MANEKRLIDANALCDRITATFPAMSANAMYVAIEKAPTIDAVEVVHGRWEWIDDEECGVYRCSCCSGAIGYPTNYCPNCGAKMDGGNEDVV